MNTLSSTSRGGRWGVGLACAALLLGATTACGADEDRADPGTAELTIAIGATNSALAPLYLAEVRGYFAAEDLEITLQSSASAIQALTSGESDLAFGGIATSALAAKGGKPTSVLMATAGSGVTIWTIARPGISSVADCERFGTFTAGSSPYAWAEILKDGFDASYEIIPFTEIPAISAALTSGGIDCANGSVSGYLPLVSQGHATWFVRPDEASTLPPNFVADVTEVGITGLRETVEQKRDAMVRFIRAIVRASEDLKDESAEAIAADLKKHEDFGAFDEQALAEAIDAEAAVMIPRDGVIDEESWAATLDFLEIAGLELTAEDADLAFDQMVDMSVYEDATS